MAQTANPMIHTGPITKMAAVTPHDSTNMTTPNRGLYIGGAGNVSALLYDDDTAVTLTALAVGVWHPIAVKRVNSTSTTASAIVVGW